MALNHSEPTEEQLKQLETIKVNHDEAYLYINQGLSYQEKHQYIFARDMYAKGLEKIDAALNVRCDRPYCHGSNWEKACKLQQKMRKTSVMIKSQMPEMQRLAAEPSQTNGASAPSSEMNDLPQYANNIQHPYSAASRQLSGNASQQSNGIATPSSPEPFEQPPSYDEACQHEILSFSRRSSYPAPGEKVQGGKPRGSTEVVELFSVQDQVILFFVSKDGSVSTSSTQSSLHIYQFVDYDAAAGSCPPAWLQIGSWSYPLVPGQSPALESGYGAFLFPNIGAGEGSAVGVVLPPSVDVDERSRFLNILNSFTAFKAKEVTPSEASAESFSDTLSRGIVTGAEYLSAGIVKGAAISSDLIHKGASKAKQKINPEDKSVVVDPRVREGLRIAREASGVALKATGFLIRKLGDLTLTLGKQIAPHVKEQGIKLLSSALNTDKKGANDKIDGVLTVAAGGLQGFSTVYMGLEAAARTLAYSLSTETVDIVGHKYGNDVGEVVGDALFSIGNLALTTHNVQSLGVKAVAKKTAKETGKAILKDYAGNEKTAETPKE